MIEKIFLGAIQGVLEWLPVSSKGILLLIEIHLFGSSKNLGDLLQLALFLHLGTFLAALVYFRVEVAGIIKTALSYHSASREDQKLFSFLTVSSLLSGLVGFVLLKTLVGLESQLQFTSKVLTVIIGLMLVVNGWLQLRSKNLRKRNLESLRLIDGIILGLVQGVAAIPGFSRSGSTISALFLLGVEKISALKLSFLMSLPIILGGNILLNFNYFFLNLESFLALLASFTFGLLTINCLMKFARKVNFGKFVLIFGLITVVFALA